MKIALYNSKGGFGERWVKYCEKNDIDYKLVNPYDSDIVEQVEDCDAFMWHHHHANYKDVLFAKQLLFSLQSAGKIVFPDFNTGWHFDDKVGQKYLLEAMGAPLVPSYVFYTKREAFAWIDSTSFPKVFKLRGGAGSQNVILVHTRSEAKRLVRKVFGKGYPQYSKIDNLNERIRKWRLGKTDFKDVMKGIARFFVVPAFAKMHAPEKGYVYFQDFIPNNDYDTRIVIIGGKYAIAEKRFVRKGDFRASGGGDFSYESIDIKMVGLAFEVARKLAVQSIAFDFIYDNEKPLIVETSYAFGFKGLIYAPGYWSSDMQWHEGSGFDFCGWMVEEVINEVNSKKI